MRGPLRGPARRLALALACTAGLASPGVGARAVAAQQDVESVTAACAASGVAAVCREWALTVQAAEAYAGLLAAGGAQVPGSASTLGRRFGGMPRMSWSARVNVLRAELPVGGSSVSDVPWEGDASTGWGLHGSLALGLFDGFSLLPTVGGLLSVDVLGAAGILSLPEGPGIDNDPRYVGLGLRVGLLRESFTLPGVTASASRRWIGDVDVRSEPIRADIDPTVTSLRLVAGKDLLALGVLAGLGWDRYQGDGELSFGGACTGSCPVTPFEDFRSERVLFFAGASLNLLLLQLSAEGGWARGLDEPAGRAEGGYDPGASSLFLSATARLTL